MISLGLKLCLLACQSLKQVAHLREVVHPNVVLLLGTCVQAWELILVTELMYHSSGS
jgi:hypothetical protein